MTTMTADPHESERLDALRRLHVLDTPPERDYDDLTRLAATICGTPISLVSLIDFDRQWFKSRHGIDAVETPRAWAFCDHAIRRPDLFVVPDATADERFADNPLVTGDPYIRFYAGMPLTTAEGHALGTLCVIDRTPRTLSAEQADALRVLARQVVAHLRLRRKAAALERAEAERRASDERFRAIFDSTYQYIGLLAPDGTILEANRTALTSAGITLDAVQGKPFWEAIWWSHNPNLQALLKHGITQAAGGEFVRFEAEHPLADGTLATIDFSLTPIRDESGAVVLLVPEGRDVTDRKRAEDALRVSEGRFRGAFDNAPIGMALVATSGQFLKVNRALSDILGYPPDELLTTDFQTLTHPADLASDLANVGKVLAGEIPRYQIEKRYFHKNGRTVYAVLAVSLARDPAGEPLYFVAQVNDITARKWAEAELRESEERFRSVVDELAEGVVQLDYETRAVVRANRAFLDLLGYTADELAARTQYDFVAHDRTDIDAKMAAVMRDGRADLGFRKYRRKDGAEVNVSVSGNRLELNGRAVVCLTVRDMTERAVYEEQLLAYQTELERANAQLHTLATTDRLTGVKNRGAFNDKLTEEFDRAVRYSHPLSVILLDVDHFKPFNDTFGHPAGDAVLKQVAAALQKTVRGSDTVARYGGEEFVVLLPDTDYAGAMVLAERCRRAIAGASWGLRSITVSVGVGTLGPTTAEAAALVKEADDALYCSKHAGRNKVSYGSGTIPMPALRT
jgi:diguanylate cyclase